MGDEPDNLVDPLELAARRAARADVPAEELRRLVRDAELAAATLKGRLEAVESELAAARVQRDAMTAELARREKDLVAAAVREPPASAERELAGLRDELAARRAEVASLRRELDRGAAAERATAERVARLATEIERLRAAPRPPAAAPPGADEAQRALVARLAAERAAFREQASAVTAQLAQLRGRLGAAAGALAERLAAERAARLRAERALAVGRPGLEADVAGLAERLSGAVAALRDRMASELATLRARAADLSAELERERARGDRLQAELDARGAEPDGPPAAAEGAPAGAGPRRDHRAELARVLAGSGEARRLEVPAVAPAGKPGDWLRPAIARVGEQQPAVAAEALLALVPLQAARARRDVLYELTVVRAGTWRVALESGTGSAEPSRGGREGSFVLSGTAGEVAALLAGGGPRRIEGRIEGRRRHARRLARAARTAPTLAQALGAGGRLSLRAALAVLAAAAEPGEPCAVAFDGGAEAVTVTAAAGAPLAAEQGLGAAGATLRAPAGDLVLLVAGLAPEAPVEVVGDERHALAVLARLHRAQGLA